MSENNLKYDLLIIGGGPGGYVAAIRATQLGLNVGLVERENLGGVCLNWGCIPTKALLRSSEVKHLLDNSKSYGFSISNYQVNFDDIIKRSRSVAKSLSSGVEHLMKKNKAKTLEEIFNNAKYIINDEVNFNENDLKLIDDKSKKIINEFQDEIKNLESLTRDNLEPIVNNLIKKHETNFKGVGQPLRVALTGSKFGPGLYDIVISLGKVDVEKRLRKILN